MEIFQLIFHLRQNLISKTAPEPHHKNTAPEPHLKNTAPEPLNFYNIGWGAPKELEGPNQVKIQNCASAPIVYTTGEPTTATIPNLAKIRCHMTNILYILNERLT